MEALADELLDMAPSYDAQHNTFSSKGVPVRHVTEKRIPAKPPKMSGAKQENSNTDKETTNFDIFTGIIDGVTGEPLNGTRQYVLTGEHYEGPFAFDGLRHGEGAIVRKVYLPYMFDPSFRSFDNKFLSFTTANFFGTYQNDEPVHGTLATDMFTYRGPFKDYLFHGENGELIHSSGYEYRGDFQDGVFFGMGREKDPFKGDYQGEFKNGMKDGMGTFKAADLKLDGKKDNDTSEDTCDKQNESQMGDVDPSEANNLEQSGKANQVIAGRYTYSGMYHCNLRHGEGTEWRPDGDIYTGQFLSDRRHGHGILRNARSGITYEGYWGAGNPMDGDEWRIMYPSA
mmetsp:Transcript_12323/g.17190  ORF Transcript_12323/g.17190 Transcript_12323/m.17190 type:complete len:342 (-) Transcript_12323:27-1052(-)